MKFNCGLTPTEKAEINTNARARAYLLKQIWHPWFAWFPVRVTGTHDCRWLETVQRKMVLVEHYYDSDEEFWQYSYLRPDGSVQPVQFG